MQLLHLCISAFALFGALPRLLVRLLEVDVRVGCIYFLPASVGTDNVLGTTVHGKSMQVVIQLVIVRLWQDSRFSNQT